jgi:hypothetical protein
MKEHELKDTPHNAFRNGEVGKVSPNITEPTLFTLNGKPVGFYMTLDADSKAYKALQIANAEFLSDRVPKSTLSRGFGSEDTVKQFSTILGSVPAKPHMQRTYHTQSSVHRHKAANQFITAMMILERESEQLIKEYAPTIYEQHIIEVGGIPKEWRLGEMFTSGICNYNIAVKYHIDTANVQNTVNAIYCKRHRATGGNLTIPAFGLTVEQADNSLLVIPVFKHIHGVTDIEARPHGYRNSFIFYPLKAFIEKK